MAGSPFDNLCLAGTDKAVACESVGKRAVTLPSSIHMPRIDLGTIVGVTWLPAGAAIGAQDVERPDDGRPAQHAPRDGYYFIVESGATEGARLLRPVGRIEPR